MEYSVLYTHQKTKKAKTWQDGYLKIAVANSRAVLYDDKRSKLDAVFIKPNQISLGEEIESDRYLIQIEDVSGGPLEGPTPSQPPSQPLRGPVGGSSLSAKGPSSLVSSQTSTGSFRQQVPRVGLKRRNMGFVPPRQVKAQPTVHDDEDPLTNSKPEDPGHTPQTPNPSSLFNMYASSESPRTFGGMPSPWSVVGRGKPTVGNCTLKVPVVTEEPERISEFQDPFGMKHQDELANDEVLDQAKPAPVKTSTWNKYLEEEEPSTQEDSEQDHPFLIPEFNQESNPNIGSSRQHITTGHTMSKFAAPKRSTKDILALIGIKKRKPEVEQITSSTMDKQDAGNPSKSLSCTNNLAKANVTHKNIQNIDSSKEMQEKEPSQSSKQASEKCSQLDNEAFFDINFSPLSNMSDCDMECFEPEGSQPVSQSSTKHSKADAQAKTDSILVSKSYVNVNPSQDSEHEHEAAIKETRAIVNDNKALEADNSKPAEDPGNITQLDGLDFSPELEPDFIVDSQLSISQTFSDDLSSRFSKGKKNSPCLMDTLSLARDKPVQKKVEDVSSKGNLNKGIASLDIIKSTTPLQEETAKGAVENSPDILKDTAERRTQESVSRSASDAKEVEKVAQPTYEVIPAQNVQNSHEDVDCKSTNKENDKKSKNIADGHVNENSEPVVETSSKHHQPGSEVAMETSHPDEDWDVNTEEMFDEFTEDTSQDIWAKASEQQKELAPVNVTQEQQLKQKQLECRRTSLDLDNIIGKKSAKGEVKSSIFLSMEDPDDVSKQHSKLPQPYCCSNSTQQKNTPASTSLDMGNIICKKAVRSDVQPVKSNSFHSMEYSDDSVQRHSNIPQQYDLENETILKETHSFTEHADKRYMDMHATNEDNSSNSALSQRAPRTSNTNFSFSEQSSIAERLGVMNRRATLDMGSMTRLNLGAPATEPFSDEQCPSQKTNLPHPAMLKRIFRNKGKESSDVHVPKGDPLSEIMRQTCRRANNLPPLKQLMGKKKITKETPADKVPKAPLDIVANARTNLLSYSMRGTLASTLVSRTATEEPSSCLHQPELTQSSREQLQQAAGFASRDHIVESRFPPQAMNRYQDSIESDRFIVSNHGNWVEGQELARNPRNFADHRQSQRPPGCLWDLPDSESEWSGIEPERLSTGAAIAPATPELPLPGLDSSALFYMDNSKQDSPLLNPHHRLRNSPNRGRQTMDRYPSQEVPFRDNTDEEMFTSFHSNRPSNIDRENDFDAPANFMFPQESALADFDFTSGQDDNTPNDPSNGFDFNGFSEQQAPKPSRLDRRQRQPLKSNPYSDSAKDKQESRKSIQNQSSHTNHQGMHQTDSKNVPIWMKKPTHDFNIDLSPIAPSVSHAKATNQRSHGKSVPQSAWNESVDLNDSLLSLDHDPYASNPSRPNLRNESFMEQNLGGSKWDKFTADSSLHNEDSNDSIMKPRRLKSRTQGSGIDHLVPVRDQSKTEIELGSETNSFSDAPDIELSSQDSLFDGSLDVGSPLVHQKLPKESTSSRTSNGHQDSLNRSNQFKRSNGPASVNSSIQQLKSSVKDTSADQQNLLHPDDSRMQEESPQFRYTKPGNLVPKKVSQALSQHQQQHAKNQTGFKPPRMVGSSVQNQPSLSGLNRNFRSPAGSVVKNSHQPNQPRLCGSLWFPSREEAEGEVTPTRQVNIPATFTDAGEYRQVLSAALREYLNIQLFEMSKSYHSGLAKVDISGYNSETTSTGFRKSAQQPNTNPTCDHKVPSKIVQVKKEGPNKGRYFFACNASRDKQCKFFKWADELSSSGSKPTSAGNQWTATCLQLSDASSIATFFRGQGVALYCDCQLVRKAADHYMDHKKGMPAWVRKKIAAGDSGKKKLFLKLSRRESSSTYTRDDLWIVSQSLTFDPSSTFMAKSVFFGPTSNNELEIEPIGGYSPSNWHSEMYCHAIHAGNASNELVCLANIEEYVNPTSLPLLPALLNREHHTNSRFTSPANAQPIFYISAEVLTSMVDQYTEKYSLNDDQGLALRRMAGMLNQEQTDETSHITLIHGVFGAGKSYLLAVSVLFLVEAFSYSDSYTPGVPLSHKILISSITNVAVDRILQGLLELGFEDFIRVGSVKKIAKPVLPYSVHASGSDNQEMKDLHDMLKTDLTPEEKIDVRKTMEKLRKGENKKKLSQVRVVGATCAACPFKCLKEHKFTVVMLDECSQMTEPSSLLPIARFDTRRLVLVGDPKQLDPTIQGSEAAHNHGLEQTMFDRLGQMGYTATILRTQYRCHPRISAIANSLFYNRRLLDGVTEEDRGELVPGLPTLCFLDVPGGRETAEGGGGSFSNPAEARVVAQLVTALGGRGARDVGVITLYRAQQRAIQALLNDAGTSSSSASPSSLSSVQVSTVDAFQGGERGVIILSCVRSHSHGFIDCSKRSNVALTRAKNHLLIVGHRRNLSKNRLWASVIQHCQNAPGGVQNCEDFLAAHCGPDKENDGSQGSDGSSRPARRPRKRKTLADQRYSDDDFQDGRPSSTKSLLTPEVQGLDLATPVPSPPMSVDPDLQEALGGQDTVDKNLLLVNSDSPGPGKRRKRPRTELEGFEDDVEYKLYSGLDLDNDDDDELPAVL